jgi:hypothetical protein
MKRPIISVLKSHTGALLISGGICLKAGAAFSSLLLAAPGYVCLFTVLFAHFKSWRDQDDHQN